MIDPEPIQERLKLLAEYVADLEAVADTPLEQFLSDKKLRRYVERTFQLAIECCLDIGHHIISALGLREPNDNRDVFRVLVEAGFIPEALRPALERMAGFRNLLVHEYARLDPVIVYGILQKRIPDLKSFASRVTPLAAAPESASRPAPSRQGGARARAAREGEASAPPSRGRRRRDGRATFNNS